MDVSEVIKVQMESSESCSVTESTTKSSEPAAVIIEPEDITAVTNSTEGSEAIMSNINTQSVDKTEINNLCHKSVDSISYEKLSLSNDSTTGGSEAITSNVNTQTVNNPEIKLDNLSHKLVDTISYEQLPQSNESTCISENIINVTTHSESVDNNLPFIKTEPIDGEPKNSNTSKKLSEVTSPVRLVADYHDSQDEDEAMDTTDKEKEIQVILEVKGDKQPPVIDVNSDVDDSSDSSSDSSDSESSDDSSSISLSGDGDEVEEVEESTVKSDDKKTKQKGPAKESSAVSEVPAIVYPDLVLPEDVVLIEMGHVSSIIGQLVVVKSKPEVPALNLDSVFFKQNRQAVGAVYDVFGPVVSPMYSIAFNTAADIIDQKIILNMPVFFAPHIKDITEYVFADKLRQHKGSDASWKNDEEPPPECVEYSDDEQERAAKNKKNEGKEGRRRKKPQRRERGNSESNEEGGRQQQHRGNRQQQWQRNRPQQQNNSGHYRGPPLRHDNGQFTGNMFPNPGYQFPPRPSGQQHSHGPPPPLCPPNPPPPLHMFPPRPPGFMGRAPPPLFNNGPPNMGFENQGPPPGQFKQEPFGVPQGSFQGPPPPPGPFPNGGFETKPMIPTHQDSQGGMWQPPPPPPPPPNANFGQNAPANWHQPPPGFPNQYPMFGSPPPPPPPGPPPPDGVNAQWQNQHYQQS